MLESRYQAQLIHRLRARFPGCLVLKNDTDYLQGIPDLTLLWGPCWAMLEVKATADAPMQPNQLYYVQWAMDNSFAAVVHPENEREVLDALQLAFESARATLGT